MGGCLSVRFPEGLFPIVKAGGDEVIFKMHIMNESRWEMEGVKIISAKSEGKGNMKVAFTDEIVGLARNGIIDKMMEDFVSELKSDISSKSYDVSPLCNPWLIQL